MPNKKTKPNSINKPFPVTVLRVSDGFVVLKGSKIKLELALTLREAVRWQWERYASRLDANGVLPEDILLRGPNEAANFVTGYPVNALVR